MGYSTVILHLVFPVGVETVMSEIDVFVSSTGVITLDHMRKLNDITLVGNTEHFDNEIDLVGSEDFRWRRLGAQLYFSPERAVQDNVSP